LKVLLPSEWEGTRREQDMMGTLYLLVGKQLFEYRLNRDGWKGENSQGRLETHPHYPDSFLTMRQEMWDPKSLEPSEIWFKTHKNNPITISISRTRHVFRHVLRNRPFQFGIYRYRSVQIKLEYEYLLMNQERTDLYPIDKITWADFDQQGRLVLAKGGKLFAGTLENGELKLTELADFNGNKPDPQPAPDWAQKW